MTNSQAEHQTGQKKTENLSLKAYVGITGNVSGFSSAEKTKLAEIAVPLKANAKGNITAK